MGDVAVILGHRAEAMPNFSAVVHVADLVGSILVVLASSIPLGFSGTVVVLDAVSLVDAASSGSQF